MKNVSLVLVFCLAFSFLFSSCKKINEATELGGGLIPPVDNVTTFDTTLSVETTNFLFSELEDTTSSGVLQFLGNINNDPLFGRTEGRMYFQVRPEAARAPFLFTNNDSLVGLDSVVLVLGFNNLYGDSTQAQNVDVYEIPTTQSFNYTADYKINKEYITNLGPLLGTKTFTPFTLNDSVFARDERTANQLRIPLDPSFGLRLLNYDTTTAYRSDSAFKTYFNGFAVIPQNNGSANALVGINLLNSKLAFYYRYKTAGRIDTVTSNFFPGTTSAIANYIKREHNGAEITSAVQGTEPDEVVYIQSSPGSYAKIKIPALGDLNNRVVHLAELQIDQIYDPLSSIFTPPGYLYLDAFDTAKQRYRTIPLDVLLTATDGTTDGDSVSYNISNANEFGMVGKLATDPLGNSITQWRFNITRYVQRIVTDAETAQELRLYSPFPTIRANSSGVEQFINSGQPYAIGRVRIGGGNHPTQRMRLRIVYSKL